jgi:hypothetical protein
MGEAPRRNPAGLRQGRFPSRRRGRYIDGFGVRFFRGKPQKVGGWVAMLTAQCSGSSVASKPGTILPRSSGSPLARRRSSTRSRTPASPRTDITPFVRTLTLRRTRSRRRTEAPSSRSHGRATSASPARFSTFRRNVRSAGSRSPPASTRSRRSSTTITSRSPAAIHATSARRAAARSRSALRFRLVWSARHRGLAGARERGEPAPGARHARRALSRSTRSPGRSPISASYSSPRRQAVLSIRGIQRTSASRARSK